MARGLTTLALTLVPVLRPALAEACASCLSSAYGDRTYNVAFVGLIVMPFLVGAAIGGALLVRYRAQRPDAALPAPDLEPVGEPESSRRSPSSEPALGSPHRPGGAARRSPPFEERP